MACSFTPWGKKKNHGTVRFLISVLIKYLRLKTRYQSQGQFLFFSGEAETIEIYRKTGIPVSNLRGDSI